MDNIFFLQTVKYHIICIALDMCFCEGHETSEFENFGVDGYSFHRGCVNDVIRQIIKAQAKAKKDVINITATGGIKAYVIN